MNKKVVTAVVVSVIVTFLLVNTFYIVIAPALGLYTTSPGASLPLIVNTVKYYLDTYYLEPFDEKTLWEGAARGMAQAVGDEYTRYYTAEEFKTYMEDTTGEFVGVGMVISIAEDVDGIVVVAPYRDSPAEKAGVLPGDIVVAVDGERVTSDMLDETSRMLRGVHLPKAEGTTVNVTFRRGDEVFDREIVREQINVISVEGNISEHDKDIGYIRISSFDSDTDLEFNEIYNSLKNDGAKSFILDLRDNPGGDFHTCCRLAGKFLKEKEIVTYLEDKNGEKQYMYASGKEVDEDIVILINANSASASEVFTGAIRDHGRAKAIIGTKSFGKGITQSIYSFGEYGGMSITADKYYTPNGECIHKVGITPNMVVELDEEFAAQLSYNLDYKDDLQLQKAHEVLK